LVSASYVILLHDVPEILPVYTNYVVADLNKSRMKRVLAIYIYGVRFACSIWHYANSILSDFNFVLLLHQF